MHFVRSPKRTIGMKHTVVSLALVSLLLSACGGGNNDGNEKNSGSNKSNETQVEDYGKLADGTEVKIFTFSNKNGMVAKVTEYGAILTSLEVPDKDGNVKDVTHGYDDLAKGPHLSSQYKLALHWTASGLKAATFEKCAMILPRRERMCRIPTQ